MVVDLVGAHPRLRDEDGAGVVVPAALRQFVCLLGHELLQSEAPADLLQVERGRSFDESVPIISATCQASHSSVSFWQSRSRLEYHVLSSGGSVMVSVLNAAKLARRGTVAVEAGGA